MYYTCGHDLRRLLCRMRRSTEKKRCMTGKEQLDQDKLEIDLPQRMLCKCAGNGMHLGSVGFSMLMAVLCLAPA